MDNKKGKSCDRRSKYIRDMKELKINTNGSRNCKYHFRLLGKLVKDSEWLIVKLFCVFHNHN